MERHLYDRSLSSLIPFALGVSMAACGGSVEGDAGSMLAAAGASASEPSVSAQEYKSGASSHAGVVDVSTAQQALTALTGNVDVLVDHFKAGAASGNALAAGGGRGGGATHTVHLPCVGGGGADLDGYMNMVPAPAAIDINVAIAFSGCATRGGTMFDGNIDFSQTLASGADTTTPFRVETMYEGDVNLSGNINLSCPVDLNVLVDESGRAIDVQGTFCHQDASQLSMQLQPLWQRQ